MCYDAAQLELRGLYRELHYAEDDERKRQLQQQIDEKFWEIKRSDDIGNIYHASGFAHPKMIVITSFHPLAMKSAQWGLIPHWCKDEETAKKLQNNTINARGETIFEKPSFRDAAKKSRCVIPLSYFFEHHHFDGKTYPFKIADIDDRDLLVAGLYSEWVDKSTGELVPSFTIVTTKANPLLEVIHNNPKAKEGRMPVLLNFEEAIQWVEDIDEAKKLIKPYDYKLLQAHPVHKLRGKEAIGNIPEAMEEFDYPELDLQLPK